MAKIYETHKDFERDKLEQQSNALELKAQRQSNTGWALMAASLVADGWNMVKATPSRALSWTSGVLSIVGVIEWIQSWRTGSKANDLRMERERLGPARVVLPPEDVPADRSFAQGMQSKTLLQHAEKTDNPTLHVL